MDPTERLAWQLERLRRMVGHAQSKSAIYRERLAGTGLRAEDIRSMADVGRLPLLEKSDLAADRAPLLLTRATRLKRTVRSAGTSGQPVTVSIDLHAWIRAIARRRYLFATHGIRYGDREGRCWGRHHSGGVSTMDRLLSRRVFTFEDNDPDRRSAEVEQLRKFDPSYLYGYSSVVHELVEHLRKHASPPPSIKAVVLTAERVAPDLVRSIREILGCPVVREYGCSETDIIAFDCPHGRYHVASDHVIVEAIEESDGIGEAVVTDLDNTLMPLIRYRLGDRIRFDHEPCPCGRTTPVIQAIEGRTGANRYLLLPGDRRRHSVLFAYLFEELRESGFPIRQFKAQQTGLGSLRIFVDLEDRSTEVELVLKLQSSIRDRVGEPMEVDVVIGPLHRAPGSKWNYFVPLATE